MPAFRRDSELLAAAAYVAGPPARLGKPDRVKDHPFLLADEVPRLGLGRDDAVPGQIEVQVVVVRLEHDAESAKSFDDLDLERADGGVHPVGAELARRAHDPVRIPVPRQREGVGDAQVRILAHADDQHQLIGAGVAVEVVPVVEVAI